MKIMFERMNEKMEAGEWIQGVQIGKDIKRLGFISFSEDRKLKELLELCEENEKGQHLYQQAVSYIEKKHWKAAASLLRDIRETCPKYGDPLGILDNCVLKVFMLQRRDEISIKGRILSFVFPLSNEILALVGNHYRGGGFLHHISLERSRHRKEVTELRLSPNSATFSPDGKIFAFTDIDIIDGERRIQFWSIVNSKKLKVFNWLLAFARSVTFSPDGKLFASVSTRGVVKVWNIRLPSESNTIWPFNTIKCKKIATFNTKSQAKFDNSLIFSPDSRLLAFISKDAMIRVWRALDGEKVAVFSGHNGRKINSIAFSPDGNILASASNDRTIKIWHVLDGEKIAAFSGHEGSVDAIAFSPDGKVLASASRDGTVRMWHVLDCQEIAIFLGHKKQYRVNSIAFSPDGNYLVSGSINDSTIRVWGT